jgi:gas vesicle protein
MKNSYGTGKVIGGILIGTLFGVALRILFADHKCCKAQCDNVDETNESEKHFRKRMKKEAEVLRKKAKDQEDIAKH